MRLPHHRSSHRADRQRRENVANTDADATRKRLAETQRQLEAESAKTARLTDSSQAAAAARTEAQEEAAAARKQVQTTVVVRRCSRAG
jgi:hypothetical protein